MDVVVPYARTMADLLEVLDVVVADDPDTSGDLWRLQPWVPLPPASAVRPASYPALAAGPNALAGKRLGVPRMFINQDPDAAPASIPASAVPPVSASRPATRSLPSGNRPARRWKPPAPA